MAFRAVKKRKRLDGEAEEDIGKVSLQIPIGIAGGYGGSTREAAAAARSPLIHMILSRLLFSSRNFKTTAVSVKRVGSNMDLGELLRGGDDSQKQNPTSVQF